MSEPANNLSEYQGPGPVSRTESVELPPIVDAGKKHDIKYIRSTLVMLLMFCAGLGWVYFEGRQGIKAAGQDARLVTVKSALAAMRPNALSGEDRKLSREKLLSPLEFMPTQCQIPATQLIFNPFEIYLYRQAVQQEASKPKESEKTKVVEEKAPSVKKMVLESVLLGSRPAAMINGKTVYIGQKVGGWTLQEIKYNRVILRWKNRTHVLKME
ncbi:MAG TPA: hypothetical protein PKK48_00015 [Phycisphaerae bacterium]|nr:hypothetical protein [Phycisphaerae bacterium]HPS53917.1 hypothetical protein [Phycisphaerae bacterium]